MMKNIYKIINIAFVFILISFLTGCDKPIVQDCENYDFSDCDLDEPEWGFLIIDVTINDENTKVPIVIYKGYMEDNIIEWEDTATTSKYEIDVSLNQYYSVVATYKSGDKTILAVDGDYFEKKRVKVCDERCWIIKGGEYNLELKY